MKKIVKFVFALFFLAIVIRLYIGDNGIQIGIPEVGQGPWECGIGQWKSEEPSLWFDVTQTESESNYNFLYGELTSSGGTVLDIEVHFFNKKIYVQDWDTRELIFIAKLDNLDCDEMVIEIIEVVDEERFGYDMNSIKFGQSND